MKYTSLLNCIVIYYFLLKMFIYICIFDDENLLFVQIVIKKIFMNINILKC